MKRFQKWVSFGVLIAASSALAASSGTQAKLRELQKPEPGIYPNFSYDVVRYDARFPDTGGP
jgi:hypothetical protein